MCRRLTAEGLSSASPGRTAHPAGSPDPEETDSILTCPYWRPRHVTTENANDAGRFGWRRNQLEYLLTEEIKSNALSMS